MNKSRAGKAREAVKARKQAREALPVLPDMKSVMDYGLVVSEDGEVYLFHTRAFPESLAWLEYDADLRRLYLVSEGGKIQDMGEKIYDLTHERLIYAEQAAVMWVWKKELKDMYIVPVITRETGTVRGRL